MGCDLIERENGEKKRPNPFSTGFVYQAMNS